MRRIIFIFLFSIFLVTNIIYSREVLIVKKDTLFSISLPSNKLETKYYVGDYNKHLISYYGKEYFPFSDEIVYYFKPIKNGISLLKIIQNKDGIDTDLVYEIEINEFEDEDFIYNANNVLHPTRAAKKIDSSAKSETKLSKKVEYEKANGLRKLPIDAIYKKLNLINKLFENGYYDETINESNNLMRFRLLKGIREQLSYKKSDSYLKANNPDSAVASIKTLNRFRDNYINKGRIEYYIGKVYYEKGDYDRAVVALFKMITKYDNNDYQKDAYYYIALSNIKQKKFNNAVEILKKIVNNFDGTNTRANALFSLGRLYEKEMEIRNFYDAVKYYRILYKDYPDLEIGNKARERVDHIKNNYL